MNIWTIISGVLFLALLDVTVVMITLAKDLSKAEDALREYKKESHEEVLIDDAEYEG